MKAIYYMIGFCQMLLISIPAIFSIFISLLIGIALRFYIDLVETVIKVDDYITALFKD